MTGTRKTKTPEQEIQLLRAVRGKRVLVAGAGGCKGS
jgi:FlaA1/EpsC-like NDP-sugar epimerase